MPIGKQLGSRHRDLGSSVGPHIRRRIQHRFGTGRDHVLPYIGDQCGPLVLGHTAVVGHPRIVRGLCGPGVAMRAGGSKGLAGAFRQFWMGLQDPSDRAPAECGMAALVFGDRLQESRDGDLGGLVGQPCGLGCCEGLVDAALEDGRNQHAFGSNRSAIEVYCRSRCESNGNYFPMQRLW